MVFYMGYFSVPIIRCLFFVLLRVIVHTFVLDVNDRGIIPGIKLLVYFVIVRVSL